jgi:hypothetical protein
VGTFKSATIEGGTEHHIDRYGDPIIARSNDEYSYRPLVTD